MHYDDADAGEEDDDEVDAGIVDEMQTKRNVLLVESIAYVINVP